MRTKIFLIVIGLIVSAFGGWAVGRAQEPCVIEINRDMLDLEKVCAGVAIEPECPDCQSFVCVGGEMIEDPAIEGAMRCECTEPESPPAQPIPPEHPTEQSCDPCPAPCIQPKVEVTSSRWRERLGVTGGFTGFFNDHHEDVFICRYGRCKYIDTTEHDADWAAHIGAAYRVNHRWTAHLLATRDKGTWGATALVTWMPF